jgi:hypothetical protein
MQSPYAELLDRTSWIRLEEKHHDEVDQLTAAHRSRAVKSRAHPVEDFLFTYYAFRPSQLRRWYPGAGRGLCDATERSQWRFHRTVTPPGSSGTAVVVDVTEFAASRGKSIGFIRELLGRTATATPQFGCFGLHEWAMVFEEADHRHRDWPLRLGQSGTDEVVRQHQIKCSHYDAFRFFTPAASGRNLLAPDLMSRDRMEQPACLHASMDLYKWAFRLVPVISSGLLIDCFLLAKQIREVDMRASPYDLSELGYQPITIETAAGKAEYVNAQRDFARRGQILRSRLCVEMDRAFDADAVLHAPA